MSARVVSRSQLFVWAPMGTKLARATSRATADAPAWQQAAGASLGEWFEGVKYRYLPGRPGAEPAGSGCQGVRVSGCSRAAWWRPARAFTVTMCAVRRSTSPRCLQHLRVVSGAGCYYALTVGLRMNRFVSTVSTVDARIDWLHCSTVRVHHGRNHAFAPASGAEAIIMRACRADCRTDCRTSRCDVHGPTLAGLA
jgi:hypothetical protein